MNDVFISGIIGYIYLKKNNINILLLSDNHSNEKYCSIDSKFISEFLESKNSKILLEEVPRFKNQELLELWSTKHIQKLKELYIKNKNIDIEGIDIRPMLIPFSLEIFNFNNNQDLDYIDNIKKITLLEYLKELNIFFNFENNYFLNSLQNTYTDINTNIGKLFLDIKILYIDISKTKNLTMVELSKDNIFVDKLNNLLSNILEWYIIAKIISDSNRGISKYIIHAGLAHTTNINKLLINKFGFEIINSNGIIDINNVQNENINCLKLPNEISNQFGGYKEKYLKYKKKYIHLKNELLLGIPKEQEKVYSFVTKGVYALAKK